MANALPEPEPFLPLYATPSEINALQEAVHFFRQAVKREAGGSQRMRLLYRLDCVQASLARQVQELRLLVTLVQEQRPQVSQVHHLLQSQNAMQEISRVARQGEDEETCRWAEREMRENQRWFARSGFALRFAECWQRWALLSEGWDPGGPG